jgi:hypothetical protein
MYDSNRAVEKDVLSHGGLGSGSTFRWHTLKASWEGYALLREVQRPSTSTPLATNLPRRSYTVCALPGLTAETLAVSKAIVFAGSRSTSGTACATP